MPKWTPERLEEIARARGLQFSTIAVRSSPAEATVSESKLPVVFTSEAQFQKHVIEYGQSWGWKIAAFRPAMNSKGQWRTAVQADGAGWLDIYCVHPERGERFVAELKFGRNKPTKAQQDWAKWHEATGTTVYVWWPKHWDEIRRAFKTPASLLPRS